MSNFTKLNKLLIYSTSISLDAAFFIPLSLPGYAEQLASAQASHATYANVARETLPVFFCSVTAVVYTTQDPPKVCTCNVHINSPWDRDSRLQMIPTLLSYFLTGHNYVDVYCNQSSHG